MFVCCVERLGVRVLCGWVVVRVLCGWVVVRVLCREGRCSCVELRGYVFVCCVERVDAHVLN